MFAEKRTTGSGFGSGVLTRRGITKNGRRLASVVFAATLTIAVVAPANAAARGAHWTGWEWASGKAAYSTSGGILDSSHSVFE